jgi:hypothetical protein
MAVLAPNYGLSGRMGKMKKAVYASYTPAIRNFSSNFSALYLTSMRMFRSLHSGCEINPSMGV